MELQHVNVKLLVEDHGEFDLEPVIPIFHGWIQDRVGEELLIDIADYRHVDGGPGVVLIGHEGNYSVDNTDHRLGVRYNRKAVVEGTNQDRIRQAARAALTACQRLESDPRLGGKVRFNGREIELFVNDRLIAPNSDESRKALEPEFQTFFQKLLRGGEYSLSYSDDPRKLFSVTLKFAQLFPTADLLQSLA